MKIHLLSGFLGSGKTTAIRTAVRILKQDGIKAAVITNDQGIRLVDSGFFAAGNIAARQVVDGCFCCNYSDLDRQIDSLAGTEKPDVIFAESVGSCTDIVATVYKPLRSYRPGTAVSLSVVCDSLLLKLLLLEQRPLFAPEVAYIYWKQIEEASLLLLNKHDLVSAAEIKQLKKALEEKFGTLPVMSFQATDDGAVTDWLTKLDGFLPEPGLSPEVDYDIYAAGEAMMGWLDCDIAIASEMPDASAVAEILTGEINEKVRESGLAVGHVKWLIGEKEKISLTAVHGDLFFPEMSQASNISLLLNARVQTDPENLSAIVRACVEECIAKTGAGISITNHSAFQPGYPRPEHRMA